MNTLNNPTRASVLYTCDYCLIEHLPFCKALCYHLKGYLEPDDARDFFEKVLHYIEKTQSQYLVADLAEFKGTHMAMAKYVNQVWCQKLASYGIKEVAVNVPKSQFGAFSNKIATGPQANRYLDFKDFTSMDDILQWLCTQAKV